MGTAAIRLKFTSVVKNGPKCYLEIAPEVSSIQNIDKVKWTQDADAIEYTVPITYKIILKKMRIFEDNQNLLQSYHSCVDFVNSSFGSLDNANGGIFKSILSDHQIYYKPLFNGNDTNLKISRPIAFSYSQNVDSIKTKSERAIPNDKSPNKSLETIEASQNRSTCVDEHFIFHENTNVKKEFDPGLQLDYKINKTVSTSAELPLLEHVLSNNNNLSIATVCKINTNKKLIERESFTKNTRSPIVNKHKYRSDKNASYSSEKIYSLSPNVFKLTDNYYFKPYNFYQTSVRSDIQVRVAHLKSAMEREILPLKIILHDLLTKCAALGFLNNGTITNKHRIDCSNKSKHFQASEILKQNKKLMQCNRVVYSIVFDG